MKKNFLLAACIMLMPALHAFGKNNVSILLRTTAAFNQTEQMVYVYHNEGDDVYIDDSAKIVPGVRDYALHSYAPYENEVRFIFSKFGPMKLTVLAHPDECLEVEVTENDQTVGAQYKKCIKGSPQNDALADFWQGVYSFANPRSKLTDEKNASNTDANRKKEIERQIDVINNNERDFLRNAIAISISPNVVSTALSLIKAYVSEKDFKALLETAHNRYPDYPGINSEYTSVETSQVSPRTTEKSRALIKRVANARLLADRKTKP